MVVEAYKKGVQSGLMIQPAVYPHFIRSKPDVSIYQVRSCDPTKSCDLTCKEWTWGLKDQVSQNVVTAEADKPKANI